MAEFYEPERSRLNIPFQKSIVNGFLGYSLTRCGAPVSHIYNNREGYPVQYQAGIFNRK